MTTSYKKRPDFFLRRNASFDDVDDASSIMTETTVDTVDDSGPVGKLKQCCTIDKSLLIVKLFYSFFYGAVAAFIPYLSIFYKQMGMTPLQIGMISGFRPFVSIFAGPLWGIVADRFQIRKVILIVSLMAWIVMGLVIGLLPPATPAPCPLDAKQYVGTKLWPKTLEPAKSEATHKTRYPFYATMDSTGLDGPPLSFFVLDLFPRPPPFKSGAKLLRAEPPSRDKRATSNVTAAAPTTPAVTKNIPTPLLTTQKNVTPAQSTEQKKSPKNSTKKPPTNPKTKPPSKKPTSKPKPKPTPKKLTTKPTTNKATTPQKTTKKKETLKPTPDEMITKTLARMLDPSDHSWMFEAASQRTLFLTYLIITLLAEIFWSAAFAMADVATLRILGTGRISEYGEQRWAGSLGHGVWSLSIGYILFYSRKNVTKCGIVLTITDYRLMFFTFAGLIGAALVIAIFLPFLEGSEHSSPHAMRAALNLFCSAHYGSILLTTVFFGMCYGIIWGYIYWHLENIGAGQNVMGVSTVVTATTQVIVFLFANRLFRVISHIAMLHLTLVIFSLCLISYTMLPNPWWVVGVEVFHGFAYAATWCTLVTYTGQAVPPAAISTVQGLLHTAYMGVGMGSAKLLGGVVIKSYGLVFTYKSFACACLIILAIFLLAQTCSYKPVLVVDEYTGQIQSHMSTSFPHDSPKPAKSYLLRHPDDPRYDTVTTTAWDK
ncbi:MFSD6 [Branchiostoma lanceolatum]|uniref:MFSD6 protein n=1 Tax=Branchiostoma lanceolatum TaxID=7740 RepID=A0A8K0E725_BRALA|nr:MFSD6 [Branchiostoma lanceolatum]